jgi:hypothetical protein
LFEFSGDLKDHSTGGSLEPKKDPLSLLQALSVLLNNTNLPVLKKSAKNLPCQGCWSTGEWGNPPFLSLMAEPGVQRIRAWPYNGEHDWRFYLNGWKISLKRPPLCHV